MKDWDNIADVVGYEVYKKTYGFAGRLVDKDLKTISMLGMPQHELGFSYERKSTESRVRAEFNNAVKIANQGNNHEAY